MTKEDEQFIKISVRKHNELIEQIKAYERSLINIYHYAIFKKEPIELIKEELNYILCKYYQ